MVASLKASKLTYAIQIKYANISYKSACQQMTATFYWTVYKYIFRLSIFFADLPVSPAKKLHFYF